MKYLIMHGSYGSPEENWFRWLESNLKEKGHQVILKQFPVDSWDDVESAGPEKSHDFEAIQSLSSWEDYFVKNIYPQLKDEEFVFVGHSIAPIFFLHMLEKYPMQVKNAIFVSPFFNIPDTPPVWQFYPANKTFYGYEFDFEKIKSQITKSHVIYGDDDPYVPQTEPPMFAEKLGSEIHVVPGGGHCGSIFTEFPLVLELATS